ncbi:hypothetical protein H2198_000203 [Neophaeococcomyces mojaviensis]|uniref:Uncharacterized protein n=1 Tax=Neophaeococcomyces mojaviensis TaxID=3383035 RepID=A0ACC3AKL4_9EURO|nr:hypothetical protein H2198_000203 [Knufia sp. JES_112]
MLFSPSFICHVLLVFYTSLSTYVHAASSDDQSSVGSKRKAYSKGDTLPVTCLNRTIETGEHITDDHGNLQYIPFLHCNETNGAPLAFTYGIPQTQTCTLDILSDEFYHLIEYFVHSDVPLSCRIPSYPLSAEDALASATTLNDPGAAAVADSEKWTPLTIALQGTLQLSHLHLHTNINVLFHTFTDAQDSISLSKKERLAILDHETPSHIIASTAYSLPDPAQVPEGTKILRNEPLTFTFNIGWIPGAILPGMVSADTGKLYVPLGVTDHRVGFSLLSFFAIAGSAGVGALGMLVYERRKSGRSMNGLLGGNVGNGYATGSTAARGSGHSGYGGYGGYGGYSGPGKRD